MNELSRGLAIFVFAKAISREKIGEPIRELSRPHRRLRELSTCSRCIGFWIAVALVGLEHLTPRITRAIIAVGTAAAVNDFAQASFRAICGAANQLTKEDV